MLDNRRKMLSLVARQGGEGDQGQDERGADAVVQMDGTDEVRDDR